MRHTLVFIVWNICSHVQSSTHFEWFLRYCFSLAIWEVCGGLGRRYISIILAVHGLFMDNTCWNNGVYIHKVSFNQFIYFCLPRCRWRWRSYIYKCAATHRPRVSAVATIPLPPFHLIHIFG